MNILIINIGFIGDSLFAASLCENLKKSGQYERVDLLIGFPQTLEVLRYNPYINNIYMAKSVGAYPSKNDIPANCDLSLYQKVYSTEHSKFNERFLDTYNKNFGLKDLNYALDLYLPKMEFEGLTTKPRIAFQMDWNQRSFQQGNNPRNPQFIIDELQKHFDIYTVGASSHFEKDENKGENFLIECGFIAQCDLFFGFPGGMHWIAASLGVPTITTSEHMMRHFTQTGDFKGNGIEDFRRDFKLHASHHFTNVEHELLPPEISDASIVLYIIKRLSK